MATEGSSKNIQEFIKALLSPQREEELDPFFVITFLPIETHHQVADIGCGPGFFTYTSCQAHARWKDLCP